MSLRPYSRRDALRLGMLGAGGLMLGGLLEACGGTSAQRTGPTTAGSFGALLSERRSAGDKALQVALGGGDYIQGIDNYLVMFLTGGGANAPRIFGDNARVWLTPTSSPNAKIKPTGPIAAPWSAYAHPEAGPTLPKGLNTLTFNFPTVGFWTLICETTSGAKMIGQTYVQAMAPASDTTLLPGAHALASVSPTTANNQGVSPICTRNPPCDMHAITIADAVRNGKPTAVIFATPEFCQSRNCGPSLDELISVQSKLGAQANFIHIEVYLNDQTQTIEQQVLSPTMQQWGLQSEPWLFLIDRNGVIQNRYEGGFTAALVQPALQQLL
ncbi:MAG: thioredoxin family protein [Actinomycetota bacterium]